MQNIKSYSGSDHSYARYALPLVNGHSFDNMQNRTSDHSYANMNDTPVNGHSFDKHSNHHYNCKTDDFSYLVPNLTFADVVKFVPKKTGDKNEIMPVFNVTPSSTQVYASSSPLNSEQTYANVVKSQNTKTKAIYSKLDTVIKSEAEECIPESHNKKDTQHLVQKQSFLNVPHNGVIAIENDNFFIYDVPGDGNCFFSSLSLAINGDFSQTHVYRSLSCSEIYNNFYIYEDILKLSHYNNITRDIYLQTMVNGRGWATSCEISMASKITQSNINIWIQGTNLANKTVFTKEQYIHSPQSRTINILLSHNHFQLLRKIPQQPIILLSQLNENKYAISNKNGNASIKRKFNFKHLTVPEKKQKIVYLPNVTCMSENHISEKFKNMPIIKSIDSKSLKKINRDQELQVECIEQGIKYELPNINESAKEYQKRCLRIKRRIKIMKNKKTAQISHTSVNNEHFNTGDSLNYSQNSVSTNTIADNQVLETHNKPNMTNNQTEKDLDLQTKCRKLGLTYDPPVENETPDEYKKRCLKNYNKIKYKLNKLNINFETIPDPPPFADDEHFNKAVNCIRSFELQEMSYTIDVCSVCFDRKFNLKNRKVYVKGVLKIKL